MLALGAASATALAKSRTMEALVLNRSNGYSCQFHLCNRTRQAVEGVYI